MARALEVRSFWGESLLDVQHHLLREGLVLQQSAIVGLDSSERLAELEDGALMLAGERRGSLNVLQREGLSIVLAVVDLPSLDRAPRSRERLWPALLTAMALHASLLAAGLASPRTEILALKGLPRPAPPVVAREATVIADGREVTSSAGGAPDATVAEVGAAPRIRSSLRGGTTLRANVLAMLGGVAMRLGSGAGGYDASSAIGAPIPARPDDDDGLGMGGAGRGTTCGPPPDGCNGFGTLGHGGGIGVPTNVAHAPDSALGLSGRCDDGPCGVPIVRCGGGCGYEATGSLPREVVRRVIRRHHNEVVFCYERALVARPDEEGRVSTRFLIDASGRVLSTSASSDTMPEVATCVARAIGRITFPSSGGSTGVSYPFDFSRSE